MNKQITINTLFIHIVDPVVIGVGIAVFALTILGIVIVCLTVYYRRRRKPSKYHSRSKKEFKKSSEVWLRFIIYRCTTFVTFEMINSLVFFEQHPMFYVFVLHWTLWCQRLSDTNILLTTKNRWFNYMLFKNSFRIKVLNALHLQTLFNFFTYLKTDKLFFAFSLKTLT